MRYAIVSDIHANLQAWNAVLIDIRSHDIDRILCLGDVIGYGPDPAETLRSVHANVHDFVLGNHDAAFCGKIDTSYFNDNARRLIEWTGQRLNRHALQFFSNMPLSLTGPDFRCTHGSFADPSRFDYVIESADALACWQSVPEALLFNGHTHVPCIFVVGRSGAAHRLPPQDFVIETGKRFLVNAGSVGQSRDGDTRAAYIIYDGAAKTIVWRRIPFDLDAFKASLDRAGIGGTAAWFLAQDPRKDRQPLREMLGFNPPQSPGEGVRGTVPVREIQVWKHRAGIWRKRCAIMSGITLAGLLGAASLYWQYGNPGRIIRGGRVEAIHAAAATEGYNLLPPLLTSRPYQGMPPGWTCRLGNRFRQSATHAEDENANWVLRVQSDTDRAPLKLTSYPVTVAAGQRLQLRAMMRKSEDFEGSIAVIVGVRKNADHGRELMPRLRVQEPTVRRGGGWHEAMRTFDIPVGGEFLYYSIDGVFTGSVEIGEPQLIRR